MEQNPIKTKRQHGNRLFAASERCQKHIDNGEKECFVSVQWENNRQISYLEAREIGRRLGLEALKEAIAMASNNQNAIKNCNWYIGQLGMILGIPYFRDRSYTELDNNERLADQMYDFLNNASLNPRSSGWRAVIPGEAQVLANNGFFVVGSSHSIKGKSSNGHIALVAPESEDKDYGCIGKTPPWIRDAHMGRPPHVKKSVLQSGCFGSSVTPPMWVVWEGQDWLVQSKICVDLDGDGHCDHLPDLVPIPDPPAPPPPPPKPDPKPDQKPDPKPPVEPA